MLGRAQRKSVVYLLVILPTLAGGAVCLLTALVETYSHVTGMPRSSMPRLNGLLMTLPALFLWIPISLLIANIVLYRVPPLRRIAERYAPEASVGKGRDSKKAPTLRRGMRAALATAPSTKKPAPCGSSGPPGPPGLRTS
jgi:hypothetical protein